MSEVASSISATHPKHNGESTNSVTLKSFSHQGSGFCVGVFDSDNLSVEVQTHSLLRLTTRGGADAMGLVLQQRSHELTIMFLLYPVEGSVLR